MMKMPAEPGSLPDEGLLVIDKPEGPTSHDVVDMVRRVLCMSRVGHTGTLDPLASGVLLVVFGRATRLARLLTGHDKDYAGEGQLGQSMDTYDRMGQPDGAPGDTSAIGAARLREAATRLSGRLMQTPPPFSARKVGGEPLYRRARRGERVEAAAAPVDVHSLAVELHDGGLFRFTCQVSAGTYVRSLVHDLGRDLGCGAHLTALRRTSVGGAFSLERAATVTALRENAADVVRSPAFLTFDDIPLDLPVLAVTDDHLPDLEHGRHFRAEAATAYSGAEMFQARGEDGRLLALAEPTDSAGMFQPRTVFLPPATATAGFTPSP